MRAHQFVIVTAALLFGCATSSSVREYLDDDTAATITVAGGSYVFARERPDLAVNARDYITATAVQTNRAGQRVVYWYCQLWSTIDRRREHNIVPANARLTLIADDRTVPLPPAATAIRPLGFGRPPVKTPNRSTEIRAAVVDAELLAFIADAGRVRIAMDVDGVVDYFVVWRDGSAATREFAAHLRK